MLRDKVLEVMDALADARQSLLTLAAKNVNTIYPAYTHHVQAQPMSLAHYLLALSNRRSIATPSGCGEAYQRLNQQPARVGGPGHVRLPAEPHAV